MTEEKYTMIEEEMKCESERLFDEINPIFEKYSSPCIALTLITILGQLISFQEKPKVVLDSTILSLRTVSLGYINGDIENAD